PHTETTAEPSTLPARGRRAPTNSPADRAGRIRAEPCRPPADPAKSAQSARNDDIPSLKSRTVHACRCRRPEDHARAGKPAEPLTEDPHPPAQREARASALGP